MPVLIPGRFAPRRNQTPRAVASCVDVVGRACGCSIGLCLRCDLFHSIRCSPSCRRRSSIVVSTFRCGRNIPGSNPGYDILFLFPFRSFVLLCFFFPPYPGLFFFFFFFFFFGCRCIRVKSINRKRAQRRAPRQLHSNGQATLI